MELKDLIAGPLTATIDADALSSQHYLDCLFKTAFESYDPATGKAGKLRMLTFQYTSHEVSGTQAKFLSIPLLTLIPLPLLQVQEADFDFEVQVIDSFGRQRQDSFSFEKGNDGTETVQDNNTCLRVALATSSAEHAKNSESSQSSLTAHMKVHVKMRQSDIPGGLATLLNKAVYGMASDVSTDTQDPNA